VANRLGPGRVPDPDLASADAYDDLRRGSRSDLSSRPDTWSSKGSTLPLTKIDRVGDHINATAQIRCAHQRGADFQQKQALKVLSSLNGAPDTCRSRRTATGSGPGIARPDCSWEAIEQLQTLTRHPRGRSALHLAEVRPLHYHAQT